MGDNSNRAGDEMEVKGGRRGGCLLVRRYSRDGPPHTSIMLFVVQPAGGFDELAEEVDIQVS